MRVQSIFRSLDGEANGYENSGQPCTFIRLRGCNLRCQWCDTSYAQVRICPDDMHMTVDEIIGKVIGSKVTITGGEPLYQGLEVATLIGRLLQEWKEISVETNGSIPLVEHGLCYLPRNKNAEHGSVRFIVDYKLPSSGMEHHMVMDQNTKVLQFEDVVKFVVADNDDLKRMNEVYIERWVQQGCKAKIAISPAISITPQGPDLRWATSLAEKVVDLPLKMGHPVQYSLQIHKILWPGSNEKSER